MEKQMEHEMQTGVTGFIGGVLGGFRGSELHNF